LTYETDGCIVASNRFSNRFDRTNRRGTWGIA
jgi:hypothetical protein